MKKVLLVFILIFTGFIFVFSASSQEKDLIVVLDSGHGGFDPGAVVGNVNEKDLNLKVTKYIKEELSKYDKVKIIETTYYDQYLALASRVEVASFFEADLFMSVHHNSFDNPSVSGTTAFVPSGNYKPELANEAIKIANKILAEVNKDTGLRNRGTQARTYQKHEHVYYPDGSLRDYYSIIAGGILHDIPSLIIEYAFMTSPDDLAFLKDDANLQLLGIATARAIAESYNLELRTSGEYDDSLQPKKKQSTFKIEGASVSKTMTFGDPDFVIPTSGGNGQGVITYTFDTSRAFRNIDGKIKIIGVEKDVVIYATKGTDGEYLPITNTYESRLKITVNPKNINLDLSYQYINGDFIVHLKALDLVEGYLPLGKVNFYLDDKLIDSQSFSSHMISINMDNLKNEGKIRVTYENVSVEGAYRDYYSISPVEINYLLVETSPTPSPTPEPTATPSPTPEPTAEPTTISPSPKISPEQSQEPDNRKDSLALIVLIVIASLALIVLVILFIKRVRNKY